MKQTTKCTECGNELFVSSRKPITNNMGDLEEVIIYVEPCQCMADADSQTTDEILDIFDTDIPLCISCENTHNKDAGDTERNRLKLCEECYDDCNKLPFSGVKS